MSDYIRTLSTKSQRIVALRRVSRRKRALSAFSTPRQADASTRAVRIALRDRRGNLARLFVDYHIQDSSEVPIRTRAVIQTVGQAVIVNGAGVQEYGVQSATQIAGDVGNARAVVIGRGPFGQDGGQG